MEFDFFKILMPLIGGVLFITSYFLSEKNEFFKFIAYFPRKREGSIKAGSIVFGAVFILIGIYNLFLELSK